LLFKEIEIEIGVEIKILQLLMVVGIEQVLEVLEEDLTK